MSILDEMLTAVYQNRPAMFAELRKKICRHEDAVRADEGWVIHCSDCGLMDESHEPLDPMTIVKDEEIMREV